MTAEESARLPGRAGAHGEAHLRWPTEWTGALPEWLRPDNYHRPHDAQRRRTPAARQAQLTEDTVLARHI